MRYRVVRDCAGFRGRFWEKGTIVDIDPSENPPHHFVPADANPEPIKPPPHRTEAVEVAPGQERKVIGGMNVGLDVNRIDRVMTVDKVPNSQSNGTVKKKDAGSVKK
jgi:hypothetical protein